MWCMPEAQVYSNTTVAQRERCSPIRTSRGEGSGCVLDGINPASGALAEDWFVEASTFMGVDNQMRIAREEVFGSNRSAGPQIHS